MSTRPYALRDLLDSIQEYRDYLGNIGLADVQHTHADLLSHLVGVHALLRKWEMPEHICRAGLFHSIYGTEGFPRQTLALSERGELRDLVGGRAEKLAYVYCAMSYNSLEASVDGGKVQLIDRFSHETMDVTEETFLELLWIKLADAVEQATESTWKSRFFTNLVTLLGPDAHARWSEERRNSTSS